ncbi:hypothetical protein ACLB2K_058032 [Fragaria x ananassa]
MIRFYELQLSVDESDGAELPLSFQLLEKETVFLFYSRGLAKEVQTWLRSGEEKIKEDEFGHILTELQGQFHAHRSRPSRIAASFFLNPISGDRVMLPSQYNENFFFAKVVASTGRTSRQSFVAGFVYRTL